MVALSKEAANFRITPTAIDTRRPVLCGSSSAMLPKNVIILVEIVTILLPPLQALGCDLERAHFLRGLFTF